MFPIIHYNSFILNAERAAVSTVGYQKASSPDPIFHFVRNRNGRNMQKPQPGRLSKVPVSQNVLVKIPMLVAQVVCWIRSNTLPSLRTILQTKGAVHTHTLTYSDNAPSRFYLVYFLSKWGHFTKVAAIVVNRSSANPNVCNLAVSWCDADTYTLIEIW